MSSFLHRQRRSPSVVRSSFSQHTTTIPTSNLQHRCLERTRRVRFFSTTQTASMVVFLPSLLVSCAGRQRRLSSSAWTARSAAPSQCDPVESAKVLPTQDVSVFLGPRSSSSETRCCIPPGSVGPISFVGSLLRCLALERARALLPVFNLGHWRSFSADYTRCSSFATPENWLSKLTAEFGDTGHCSLSPLGFATDADVHTNSESQEARNEKLQNEYGRDIYIVR